MNDRQPPNQRPPLVVRQLQRLPVADPQMDTTSARVHPQQMSVPELVPERTIEHTHGGGDERPTPPADACAGAASADGVVVGHVDVEHELA